MHAAQAPPSAWPDRSRREAVRVRLVVALLLPFAALMGVSTIQAFTAWGPGDRLPGVLILIVAGLGLPIVMAVLARAILHQAVAIDAERAELVELYSRARLDALLDGLTGLGNHRAFQDELARQ